MQKTDFKIGQVITYSVCASIYTGQIVKIKEETLIVINDGDGMKLWNAGVALGHEITINQIK